MNPHNYYTIFTRKSKPQKLVILSETQCSEVSKSHESKYYQINVPKANPKDNYANSPKVSDSLSIHNSPKWILRLFQRLSMTALLFLTIPSTNLSNLHAVDLDSILPNCQSGNDCSVKAIYGEVTNSGTFIRRSTITLDAGGGIDTFINYGIITDNGDNKHTFYWTGGYISNIINYGIMGGIGGYRWQGVAPNIPVSVTNYGKMKGVEGDGNADITIDNRGVIDILWTGATHYHLSGGNYYFVLKNYALIIQQDSNTFNTITGERPADGDNSHLIVRNGNIRFHDKNSKMILDFNNNFEFGKEYSLDRLIMNADYWGTWTTRLPVEFYRLTTRSELYTLTQSGNNFIVNLANSKTAGYSMVGMLHKSNIKTMNNFFLQSNNVIYQQKRTKRKRTLQRRVIRKKVSNLFNDSSLLESLQSNESFAYKSDIDNSANDNATNQNSANRTTTRRRITTQNRALSNQNDKYYFVLTPFVAHNYFFEAGRYNLSGLEYGFITAFSGKITPSNALGAHFAFSYGSLSDKNDKIFNITSSNLMVGLNYKFNMIWNMYLKARIDAFYFLNQVQSTMTSGNIMKPNNLGFGASVAYGKEWDFDRNGILGLEVALDYKGLMSPTILTQNGGDSTINESFNKALYNMLYVDLGLNYDKYFESSVGKWGLDTGLGVKVNATANALAKSTIRLNNIRDIDMVLDNDMFLAYLNIGGSYLLESKDFDMEFSLAYYGNFGDRSMSNAGGFEWRVYW